MRRFLRLLEAAFAAAAFAEEGDAETARRIAAEAEQDPGPSPHGKHGAAPSRSRRAPGEALPVATRARRA